MVEPYLLIEGLSKRFARFTALDSIDLEIGLGEFVCFLGPSGCGKTTLLRAIAGLDPQTSGRIHQGGRDVSALPPGARDFGIVFQSYALFPNLTIADNIGYGLKSRRMKRADIAARVAEMVALVGLGGHEAKYPSQISGGQQQRVALARALAISPGLLLLDEPLSALDAKVRMRLRHEIRSLQRRLGLTTIMVTHDQEEALAMADRIVVMNAGRIEQVGTPQEIYAAPASPFVADFVGHMNFFTATASGEGCHSAGHAVLRWPEAAAVAPGTTLSVSIRPEDIEVEPRNGDGRSIGANAIAAVVREVHFLGAHNWLLVDAPDLGEGPFAVQLPAGRARSLQFTPGADIALTLPADRLRIYGSQPGSA